MIATFFTALLSFISTNIDDIFVLMILYAQVQNSKGIMQIVAGQYLGIGTLVALSILGAFGTQIFPSRYIGLLGFLPLFLGIRSWITYQRRQKSQEQKQQEKSQISFFSVSLLTIANGADNIGVYIPVFSGYTSTDYIITSVVFAGMIALWCYWGLVLVNYPFIKEKIVRYQSILVPVVLIVLGISILVKNYLL